MREGPVQQRVRLAAAQQGIWLMRNNSGACYDDTGRLVRYGLGNDSAQVNRRIKSSDLIGITPMIVMPHHVGQFLGVFTALEVKESGWNGSIVGERLIAQQKFHHEVINKGGYAGFISDPSQLERIIRR